MSDTVHRRDSSAPGVAANELPETGYRDTPDARWDLIIVGAGLGGCALAWSLRASGLRILMLERGGYISQEPENWDPREVITGSRYDPDESWVDGAGRTFRPRVYYNVGGSSKFFGGSAFRLRREDFRAKREEGSREGLSAPSWPILYEELAPWYDIAEQRMMVHGARRADPTDPERSSPYPYPPVEAEPDTAWLRGRLERAGLHPFPLPIAVHQGGGGHCRKGSPCDGFPCKIRAKGDGENAFLRPALREIRRRSKAVEGHGSDHIGSKHTGRDNTGRDHVGNTESKHTGRDNTGSDHVGSTESNHLGSDNTGRDHAESTGSAGGAEALTAVAIEDAVGPPAEITLVTGARVLRLEHDRTGRRVTQVVYEHQGTEKIAHLADPRRESIGSNSSGLSGSAGDARDAGDAGGAGSADDADAAGGAGSADATAGTDARDRLDALPEGHSRNPSGRVVLAAGAANSAALLLRSRSAAHPRGLANGSGQVGRNFMAHNNTVLMAINPFRRNRTWFQKTLAINDWYRDPALGNIQMRGKVLSQNLAKSPRLLVRILRRWIARHSFDFWVMSEDLPSPENRVEPVGTTDAESSPAESSPAEGTTAESSPAESTTANPAIRLSRRLNNLAAHRELVRRFRRVLRTCGFWFILERAPEPRTIQHQVGTIRFGDDPDTSPLNRWCRSHEVENLYVVDGSVFPSSAAVNPALTIAANALRVGDHLQFEDDQQSGHDRQSEDYPQSGDHLQPGDHRRFQKKEHTHGQDSDYR